MKRPGVKRAWFPVWEMPTDPVKAVFWFMHWLLQVVVRFFWLPLVVIVGVEVYLNWVAGGIWNGILAGLITLLIGGIVWLILRGILGVANAAASLSRVVSNLQQDMEMPLRPMRGEGRENEGRVVEGTISEIREDQPRQSR